MKCFESLKSYMPSSLPLIALKSAKLLGSTACAGASTILAKQIYEVAVTFFIGNVPYSGLYLTALTINVLSSGYCSHLLFKSAINQNEVKPTYKDVKEIVAFATGEGTK
jgi:hypothetical protein